MDESYQSRMSRSLTTIVFIHDLTSVAVMKVTKTFKNQPLLKDVSWEVKKGERVRGSVLTLFANLDAFWVQHYCKSHFHSIVSIGHRTIQSLYLQQKYKSAMVIVLNCAAYSDNLLSLWRWHSTAALTMATCIKLRCILSTKLACGLSKISS